MHATTISTRPGWPRYGSPLTKPVGQSAISATSSKQSHCSSPMPRSRDHRWAKLTLEGPPKRLPTKIVGGRLEQAFNSLDAQREACAAFILSQKHEGWTVSPTLALSRSALARLDLWRLSFMMAKISYAGYCFPSVITGDLAVCQIHFELPRRRGFVGGARNRSLL